MYPDSQNLKILAIRCFYQILEQSQKNNTLVIAAGQEDGKGIGHIRLQSPPICPEPRCTGLSPSTLHLKARLELMAFPPILD